MVVSKVVLENVKMAVRDDDPESLSEYVTAENLQEFVYVLNGVRNMSLLALACVFRATECVKTLLDLGADVNALDANGNPPMTHLLMYPRYGEEPDDDADFQTNTEKMLEITKLLIAKGADVNLGSYTPLLAITNRPEDTDTILEIVQILLDAGADRFKESAEQKNALMNTIDYENLAMFRQLADNGDIKPNNEELYPPDGILFHAVRTLKERSPEFVEILIAKGAEPNVFSTEEEMRILSYTIREDLYETAKFLVNGGADANYLDVAYTPLMLSVTNAPVDFLQLLLDKGADINKTGYNGLSALHAAVYTNAPIETVEFLVEKGADISLKHDNGKTALDIAKEMNRTELYDILAGIVAPPVLWKGYTKPDGEFFNSILENETSLNNVSMCPFCLQYTERKDACKYMTHTCPTDLRHPRLYSLYKNETGSVYWCTVCGRHCFGHRHFALSDTSESSRSALLLAQPGADVFANESCPLEGGGGPEEKLRRVDGLLRAVCKTQDDVDKRKDTDVRKELIESAWKAASGTVPVVDILAAKKFDIPCGLPSLSAATTAAPAVPDIANVNPMPTKHENGECAITMEDCDVYEFKHLQPDGTFFTHLKIGKDAIRDMIKNSGGSEDKCPIETECKGKLYPDELTEIFADDPVFLANYKARFNEKNKVGGKKRKQSRRTTRRNKKFRGGNVGGMPIMSKMEDGQCALAIKSKGAKRRRTYRKRKASRKSSQIR